MKNKNRFMILLIIAVFIACLGAGAYTYAKYLTNYKNNSSGYISKWYITLNGENMNSKQQAKIAVEQVENEHIADGVIAPTSLASFKILVDANETDLDLEYKIKISSPDNSVIRDFSIYKIKDLITKEEIKVKEKEYTGTMNVLNDDGTINKNKKIEKEIFIQWIDDDTIEGHMTDAEDTKAAEWIEVENEDGTKTKIKNMGIVNVEIEFKQIAK